MKRLWLLALPVAVFASCNDSSNREMENSDTTTIQPQAVDTTLNHPGDSARTDTIRMDTSQRSMPADTTKSGKRKK
ncbi:hypothetical protein HHL16_03525 [Pseudoflavitalea sp. G-6-1-2]|uniref:hypothetical protein n=1 Tax=Pseudoflavitalea sp. G-6-1-2 TaxID=2728841 RepID=UPI00146E1103|nr:hypothetical protein [Pseudoflavitalea sp. G-6-1-2]NML19926.1 hypothetical protein [Pseudoflavitalea sp. G-6-1-2]